MHSLIKNIEKKIVDSSMFMYLIPCQGENKPILLKIGNQGVVFYSHGWLDPASAGGGDECFKFMTSWGGGEGASILASRSLSCLWKIPRF